MRRTIDLTAGTIDYEDTGGDGPVVVLLHGLMMDASLYDDVVAPLARRRIAASRRRCRSVPTVHPMNADADLSPRGIAAFVAEFLERLDLDDVTLVGTDTGGALVQLSDGADGTGRGGTRRPDRPRLLRRVRQLPARPDRPDDCDDRQAPAVAVRPVHEPDAD